MSYLTRDLLIIFASKVIELQYQRNTNSRYDLFEIFLSFAEYGARANSYMFKVWWAQEAICGAPWRPPRIEDENPYVPILVRTRVARNPRFQLIME